MISTVIHTFNPFEMVYGVALIGGAPPSAWPGLAAVDALYQARRAQFLADGVQPLTHERLNQARYVLLYQENWATNRALWYPSAPVQAGPSPPPSAPPATPVSWVLDHGAIASKA